MASKKLPKVYQLGDTVAVQRTRRSDKSGLGEMGHGHGEMRMRRLLVIFLTVDDVRWYSSYDQFGNFISVHDIPKIGEYHENAEHS